MRINTMLIEKRSQNAGTAPLSQTGYDSQRLLTAAQSKVLKDYINNLTERGLPPTNAMVKNFAAQIAQREPGPHWCERWSKANKEDLKSGYLTPIDGARKRLNRLVIILSTMSFWVGRLPNSPYNRRICTTWMKKASLLVNYPKFVESSLERFMRLEG